MIEALIRETPDDWNLILDSPPGASCSMMTVAEAAEFVLLVTEPTPFGIHDLKAAIEALREIDRPMGVVINRSDWGDDSIRSLCAEENVPILLEIPHLRQVAEAYAKSRTLIESVPEIREDLHRLLQDAEELIKGRMPR